MQLQFQLNNLPSAILEEKCTFLIKKEKKKENLYNIVKQNYISKIQLLTFN